jgi:hypothetical protein
MNLLAKQMTIEYYYYIMKSPTDNASLKASEIPVISKIRKDKFEFLFELKDKNEAEGPFDSLYDLKKKSFIFSSVKLDKHRQRILKSGNIKEITDFILTDSKTTCDITFMGSLNHTMVGKITNQKVKGVHFFNPDEIRIIEKILINDSTGVYSARIEKLNKDTGVWIAKEEITNFFPDNWSIHRLFHECLFAYNNKIHVSNNIFKSKTISGILIKIVINEHGKILTIYPEIGEE